jgi:calcineurin-like phosphoesterase family protein
MRYFTSDWHLNETRITPQFNPFYRPFKSIEEQNEIIISKCNALVGPDDELVHLGDVAIDEAGVRMLDRILCKNRTLIIGNYDDDKLDLLGKYFKVMHTEAIIDINGIEYYLNHYPANAMREFPKMMSIVGHIHGLWKVQPNMINVGIDAWNYEPIDENKIGFITTAIEKYYDENVFPLTIKLKEYERILQ